MKETLAFQYDVCVSKWTRNRTTEVHNVTSVLLDTVQITALKRTSKEGVVRVGSNSSKRCSVRYVRLLTDRIWSALQLVISRRVEISSEKCICSRPRLSKGEATKVRAPKGNKQKNDVRKKCGERSLPSSPKIAINWLMGAVDFRKTEKPKSRKNRVCQGTSNIVYW